MWKWSGACEVCGTLNNLAACKGCGGVLYCGTACQTEAWGGHKKVCKILAQRKYVSSVAVSTEDMQDLFDTPDTCANKLITLAEKTQNTLMAKQVESSHKHVYFASISIEDFAELKEELGKPIASASEKLKNFVKEVTENPLHVDKINRVLSDDVCNIIKNKCALADLAGDNHVVLCLEIIKKEKPTGSTFKLVTPAPYQAYYEVFGLWSRSRLADPFGI